MLYKIKALADGQVTDLTVEASSPDDARAQLGSKGIIMLAATPARMLAGKSRFSLALFTHELTTLLDAGLSLTEAVDTLREKEPRNDIREVLDRLANALYEGQPLSNAMALQPEHFPELFVSTLRAAERTGQLPDALRRYQRYAQTLSELKKKMLFATIYPALVTVVGGFILSFLLLFVVPRFASIYHGIRDLPVIAQLMMLWGDFAHAHMMGILLSLMLLVGGFVFLMSQITVRAQITLWILRLPQLARYHTLFSLSRFYRSSGMLLQGGIPAVTALSMAKNLLPPTLQAHLVQALDEVRHGKSLSETLHTHQLTTPIAMRLLRVGEETGTLGDMLDRIGAFMDEELDRAVEVFVRIFGPLLMLLVGGLIGVIVFFLYMPIFELADTIQ